MGRAMEHFSGFVSRNVWTAVFSAHGVGVALGASKVRGQARGAAAARDSKPSVGRSAEGG